MERNEVLKKAIEQNCDLSFVIGGDVLRSIDALEVLQTSGAKAFLKNIIQDVIITTWKNENISALKMVCKEVNLLANKGAENGTRY